MQGDYFYELIKLLWPLIVFTGIFVFGLILRKIIFSRLLKWASQTRTDLDDIIITAVKSPFVIWCAMFGIFFALKSSHLPEEAMRVLTKIILVLGIFSVTIVISNIATAFIKSHSAKGESGSRANSLMQNTARIVVFTVGVLIILNSLGISITPILATLGVGGLAVALALQDTLSNLFAGLHITLARQVKIGDYIKLESGQEGNIVDINWRTTKINLGTNNLVLIPNSKLSQSIITNYCLPDKEMIIAVSLVLNYENDLKKVEKAALEVAVDVQKKVSGAVADFVPLARFADFTESGVQLTIVLKVKEFSAQNLVKHEFIKQLHSRFKEEGITIPLIRVIKS